MAIEIFQDECIIVNTREQENGNLFVVFMIRDCGLLRGIVDAELRLKIGEAPLFHYANICFFERTKGDDLLQICGLTLLHEAQKSPPAF